MPMCRWQWASPCPAGHTSLLHPATLSLQRSVSHKLSRLAAGFLSISCSISCVTVAALYPHCIIEHFGCRMCVSMNRCVYIGCRQSPQLPAKLTCFHIVCLSHNVVTLQHACSLLVIHQPLASFCGSYQILRFCLLRFVLNSDTSAGGLLQWQEQLVKLLPEQMRTRAVQCAAADSSNKLAEAPSGDSPSAVAKPEVTEGQQPPAPQTGDGLFTLIGVWLQMHRCLHFYRL